MAKGERDSAAGAQSRIGTVLREKYRLDGVLGQGGMAVVYEATHRNRARFAVKVLHKHLSQSTDARSRFLREGYAANSVQHPGAVLVVDDDVAEDGSAFLVMELLDGVGCEELWKAMGRQLAPDLAAAIVLQLLGVLAAAHANGVVHRDVKPANLFLTRTGTVKVLDFGIARAREIIATANRTRVDVLLGTPAFMSPEQASGKARDLDGRTDLWSAGATYFTLTSGQYVHASAQTALELLLLSGTTPPRSLATAAALVPPAIVAVVDRALAFRAEDRWPTAEPMRDALAAACRSCFGGASPEATVAQAVQSVMAARRGVARTVPLMSPGSAPPLGGAAVSADSPVSNDPVGRRDVAESSVFFVRGPQPRTRRTVLQATAAAALLTGILSAAVVLAVKGSHRRLATDPAATVTSARTDPVAGSGASAPAAVLAPLPTDADAGTVDVAGSGLPVAQAPPRTPAPAVAPHLPAPSPIPHAAARPSSAPSSPKGSCDPNWYIDSAGIKKYKAECL